MNTVCRDIFRAIHEGKWLKIEYRNQSGEKTTYWIGIQDINVGRRMLKVDGMRLGSFSLAELNIYIDSILSATLVEGTYYEINKTLINDIAMNPDKYRSLFDNMANLKILNYLELCNKMDNIPYNAEYALIKCLDGDKFAAGDLSLSDEQFDMIVKEFSYQTETAAKSNYTGKISVKQLALNVLSINTKRGLYVLAYRRLRLNVKERILVPDDDITVCTEYMIDGTRKETVRRYLDAEEYDLLSDFEGNSERIKDAITKNNREKDLVDDMPYVIAIGYDVVLDLHAEYESIIKMYEKDVVPVPIKAFFGNLLDKPQRRKSYPIILIDNKTNMDQLLAINTAMRYPTTYIQGPPGTGKTNTIINTIVTAFFNGRTVLFASNNNHPIDGVFDKLKNLKYKDKTIPFPVLRLGNTVKVKEALNYIKQMAEIVEPIQVYEKMLDKRKDRRTERAGHLTQLLKVYEERLDLEERREAVNRLIDAQSEGFTSAASFEFSIDLQTRQLKQIDDKLKEIGTVTESDALKLLDENKEDLMQYLYYSSAGYLKQLFAERNSELKNIIFDPDEDARLKAFNEFLKDTKNVKKLQKIFPVIITTCISAHRLGGPEPIFDMTIMDEASQCNTAVSLVPIIRGENLMLVGDPQQLNPVILLDEFTNERLKKQYKIPDEYDYRKNSIYKVFLACDSVSDEILLHYHYRCDPRIIGFNNKKFYNSQLSIKSGESEEDPLIYVNVKNESQSRKNTSVAEAEEIVDYILANRDKNIGIITPFVNQRDLIIETLNRQKIDDVACGTVHSFQGDEKDVVLFSTAIGSDTPERTYDWVKTNRELINVATSRAKKQLIVLADSANLDRLHKDNAEDDLYELVKYVQSNGKTVVTPKKTGSRALGVKPFSTETESAFLENLSHALDNIWYTQQKCTVHKEVAISQVFSDNLNYDTLFYTGRFDYVVYTRSGKEEIPVLAIELDGKEHLEDAAVKLRDRKKNEICRAHNLQLIRVENSYARRYNYIKSILTSYFESRRS